MSAPIVIPPRLKLFLGRHIPSILVLSLLMPAHILLVRSCGGPSPVGSGLVSGFPLAWLWVRLFESSDTASTLFTVRYILVVATAVFLLLGMWRLTQNRLVSIAAGALVLLHPLTIQTVASESGLSELLGVVFAAWLFCVHSRPRHRSARFPNRRPSPFAWATFGICAAAAVATPIAWVFPLLLIAMDLAFDRDRGGAWWERDWRGYARYAALIPIPLVLHFISSDPIVTSSFGPAQLLSPRLAASAPVWTGLLAWPILLIGIGCFVLDQLSRIGDRKTGVRFVGFASSWFFVSAVIAPILTDGLIAGGALTGMLGVIGGFSVLLFRLSTRLESEHQIVTPRQVSLAWQPGGIPASASSLAATDDHSTADTDYRPPHALTQTLDRLADLRPRIISHGSDLPQEERNHLESLLDPLLCLSASVIEFSSGPSPWAVHVASRVGQYTMLSDQPSSSDRDTLAQHLEGLEGCSVLELSCWKPDSDARKADVILAAAGFPTDPSLASQILDQLAPDGVVVTLATDSVLASSALTAVSSDARPFAMARAAESVSRGESS